MTEPMSLLFITQLRVTHLLIYSQQMLMGGHQFYN